MMLWLTIFAWAVPFFFVLGAAWFGVRLAQEFWAGLARLARWCAEAGWSVSPARVWARFWQSRRPERLMRFAVFRRWVP